MNIQQIVKEAADKITVLQQEEIQRLKNQIEELRQFADVSMVRNLTVKNAELHNELTTLKRRFDLLSKDNASLRTPVPSTPAPTPAPEPVPEPPVQPEREQITVRRKTQSPDPVLQDDSTSTLTPTPTPVPISERPSTPEPEPSPVQSPEPSSVPSPAPSVHTVHTEDRRFNGASSAPPNLRHSPEPEEEVVFVELQSGNYFLDPQTGTLYQYVNEETAGDIVSTLKSLKIRGESYYQDRDNTIYERLPDGDIGKMVGYIKDKRAIFRK